MIFRILMFIFFCLGSTVRKNIWMRTTFVTVMAIFSKIPFWNVLDHNCVQRSGMYSITAIFNVLKGTWSQLCSTFFLNNYEAHWQRHLRDNSRLKILWKWINKMLILSEQKLRKVAEKLSVVQKSKLQRTLHQNRRQLTYYRTLLILSNLVFKFNLMLI